MDIKQDLEKLRNAQNIASIELETLDWNVRPGFEMKKRQNETELPQLMLKYETSLMASVLGLNVKGAADQVQKFCHFAQNEEVVEINGSIYNEIAKKVWRQKRKNSEFTAHDAMITEHVMREEGGALGVNPNYIFLTSFEKVLPVNNFDDTVKIVTDLVNRSWPTLNALYIKNQIVNAALKVNFAGKVFPVAIYDLPDFEANNVNFFGRGFETVVVPHSKEITPDYTLEMLSTVNKKLKSKRSSTEP